MTLPDAMVVAKVNAEAAAALSLKLAEAGAVLSREAVYELVQLGGKLLCAAREMEARVVGVPEARMGQ